MPEFKLARLRYTWQNAWTTGTVYARDSIVSYNGKVYVCLSPNTAGTFSSDLASGYWSLLVDGKTWKGAWQSGTGYALGNIVLYGGTVYYCTTANTASGNFATDIGNWAIYSQPGGWGKAWTSLTAYGIGQVVTYNGIVYKCTVNHISGVSLEANISNWSVLDSGVYYTGNWTGTTVYHLNDIVKVGAQLWICSTAHTSVTAFDTTKWTLWMPGEEYAGQWSSVTTYQLNDVVQYGGYEYISLTSNNTNNNPYTSPANWTIDTTGYSFKGNWTSGILYQIGSVVRRNGNLFVALTDNTSTDPILVTPTAATYVAAGSSGTTVNVTGTYINLIVPGQILVGTGFTSGQVVVSVSTSAPYTSGTVITDRAPDSTPSGAILFTGVNSTTWSLVAPGVYWRSFWALATTYVPGDLVIWGNTTYKCIQYHSSTQALRPDNDSTNTYWVIYLLHARHNAGNSVGDITTNLNGTNTALPIGPNTFALRATNSYPGYRYINSIPNVYYVAPTGTDSTTYGVTVDQPWKTIAYACNQLLNGFINQNAVYLLSANKEFMVQEMYQWMLFQKANSLAPFSPSSVFDATKTPRDARLVLDAVIYDLARGGNSQTVAATLSYFATSSSFVNSAVASEMPYFIAALNYLASLVQYILASQTPPVSYQTANNVASPIAQVTSGILWSETGAIVPANNATINVGLVSNWWNINNPSQTVGWNTTINLVRGNTYTFALATGAPLGSVSGGFYIQTTGNGYIPANVYNNGVIGNGANSGTVTFTVPYSAPSVLYYQNGTASVAYGRINIYNSTDTVLPVPSAYTSAGTLFSILTTALTNTSTSLVPTANNGLTATIFVKTGTYKEIIPISIPENVAVVGDELRGVVVQPATSVSLTITSCTTTTFTANATTGLTSNMPVQFAGTAFGPVITGNVVQGSATITNLTSTTGLQAGQTITGNGIPQLTTVVSVNVGASSMIISAQATATNNTVPLTIGSVTIGQTYYVVPGSITATTFSVSTAVNGSVLTLPATVGSTMTLYGGLALSNMFYMRNGTGLRNMTLTGLLGTLTAQNQFYTQRPSGGSYVSLDPGAGPNDTTVWIFRRSPYVQNVTTFGTGCVGYKVDGTLHNGGNKSIVSNDFTQVLSDGIGIWCTGPGALTEAVSVFSYYNYTGYLAEAGGRIRATNGNSSYGTYGVIAEGYDVTETPASGVVFNRSAQVQAQVQSSFGANNTLQKISYSNAGSGYYTVTTNLLQYSNLFTNSAWYNDSYVTLQQNQIAPTGYSEAWTFTGITSSTDSAYLYQNLSIQPASQTYVAVTGTNISGSGAGATFNVTPTGVGYTVVLNSGGSNYVSGNVIKIFGSQLGGVNVTNDLLITVTGLSGNVITNISSTGTPISSSSKPYVFSIYAKQGNAPTFDVYATFSGSNTFKTGITFTWSTLTATSGATGAYAPTVLGVVPQPATGWYRIYMSVYDQGGLNNQLQIRLYPRGQFGNAGYTIFYGAQLQIDQAASVTPMSFYLETQNKTFTSFANLEITGSGNSAVVVADETRSGSVFQTYINSTSGGGGYLTASNQAQGGSSTYITLAASDINNANNYYGLRVFITSGLGVGQYGYISSYNPTTKIAQVLQESFDQITVTSISSNSLFLGGSFNTNQMYVNQAIQFLPTQYNITITQSSQGTTTLTSVTGGVTNVLTITSTSILQLNMPISFNGSNLPAAGLVAGYTYYVSSISANGTDFQIATGLYGSALPLITTANASAITLVYPTGTGYLYGTGSTANMTVNQPITFSGITFAGLVPATTYYVNTIVDANTFTISNSLTTITVTATTVTSNLITTSSTTASLTLFYPIVFSGTTFGNIVAGTTYYISHITNSTQFTVASSLVTTSVTATTAGSNLITCVSTTGFVANNPIVFTGITFGGISVEFTYYILAINNSTSFTISASPNGNAINLSTGVGVLTAKTTSADFALSSNSGSFTGTSTGTKRLVTTASGSMTGTISTAVFGGSNLTQATTYYVLAINSGNNSFTITSVSNGLTAVTLTNSSGSMNVGSVGWDHIVPGTPIIALLGSSTQYYIEPRPTFSDPAFSQTAGTSIGLAATFSYKSIAYGNNTWLALPSGGAVGAISTDGLTWGSLTLPASASWTSIAYGNSYWVAVASGSNNAYFSATAGQGWRTNPSGLLPATTAWSQVAYGMGMFVAISSGSTNSAYSTNYGYTWTAGAGLSSQTYTGLAYGLGTFVAVASGSSVANYSTDGINWNTSNLPTTTTWSGVAYGNGRFVAISSTSAVSAYSFNGITWYSSNLTVSGSNISYGNGTFVVVNGGAGLAYISEDGFNWKQKAITSSTYTAMQYGVNLSTGVGVFSTLAGIQTTTASGILAGTRTKGRFTVTSGSMTGFNAWEPGSGYTATPTVSIFDNNATSPSTPTPRLGNGVLGAPSILNPGVGYGPTTTYITITGNGYANAYQSGYTLIVNNLTSLPSPGANLTITGLSTVYKITSASAMFGTVAPNIEANLQINPNITSTQSPADGTAISIRNKYSQVRLTNHDFLNIGYGNFQNSNYPGFPASGYAAITNNQTVENNYGRVFFTSSDQDGNFKVGALFGVQQSTGIVTLSVSQFGLGGLNTLSLGGIAVGGSSVTIQQFSTDGTFAANSDGIIPTQRAIKTYVASRLSQGGSNTYTSQLLVGTLSIGGPNIISSQIPQGTVGFSAVMRVKINFSGANAAVVGAPLALDYMLGHSWYLAQTQGQL